MTPSDYEYLRKLLKERSGLDLSADKQYLVESRLLPLARKSSLPGIPELVQKIKNGANPLTAEVVEAMQAALRAPAASEASPSQMAAASSPPAIRFDRFGTGTLTRK